MRNFIVLFLICCVVNLAGCAKRHGEDVVAVVNGREITMVMLDERIERLPKYYQIFASRHKKEVLEEMIAEQLFYEEAMRRKLDREPEVKELMDETVRKVLISKLIEIETKKSAPVSEDDIERYYEENIDKYTIPALVRASHILTNTEEEAKKALEEIRSGADFAETARSYSKDLTKDRGGDLGFFKEGQMVPEFEKVCFSLNTGEVSDVVKTRFGYHIIKLTDRKKATRRELEDVKESIRTIISRTRQSEKFNEFTQSLKDKAKITRFDELLITEEAKEGKDSTPAEVPAGKR